MRKSSNYRILRNILSKIRRVSITPDMSYFVIYSFLFKYCSDSLKDHYLHFISDKEMTLDEAYIDESTNKQLKEDAFNMFGFFINRSDCFFDEIVSNHYQDNFFLHALFESFAENVEFEENSNYENYFNFIFDSLRRAVNFNKYEFEGQNHLIVKEIIYLISKLNIFEEEFPIDKVFDKLCESPLIRLDSDPEYINLLLSNLILMNKDIIGDVYSPFLNDASGIISLENNIHGKIYAKGSDNMTYCCSIVKFLMHKYDLDQIFLEFGPLFESADIKNSSFDVITSRIPAITSKSMHRLNRVHNEEILKRNKRKELTGMLSENFNMDEESFSTDEVLKNTLEELINKMDFEIEEDIQFRGEYEILKDSEYLFLINLINTLKDNGIMVVAMAQSFLFKNTLKTLRKYLCCELNCIDTIISVPEGLSRSRTSEIIIVFKKNRNSDDILFVDMSTDYKTKKMSYNVPGLFTRNLTFTDESINNLLEVCYARKTVDKFSEVVKISYIISNEFNLSISRYVDTFEGEFVKLSDLKNEKKEITSNIKKLNKKIDEMMDELNIKI